jgi:predicted nucleotidyltransferase component of viral defense system
VSRPRRDTTSGRVYLDLRARARAEGRPTDELLVLYVLERFLYRLSASPHRDRLILKGGMLLAALDQRRPTRDVDLLAIAIANDINTIAAVVRDIAMIDVDDGVVFGTDRMTTQQIREHDLYAGVRVVVPATVDRAQQPLRVDVNVGDPVTPAPQRLIYPALLDEPFELIGYPIETVLAEKLVTMVALGDTTTRERDFADVLLLTDTYPVDAARLSQAIAATAAHRDTTLRPIREATAGLGARRQADWQRYLARAGLADRLPGDYTTAIDRIAAFADPILTGSAASGRWSHAGGRWKT